MSQYQIIAVYSRSWRLIHQNFYSSYETAVRNAIAFNSKNIYYYRDYNKIKDPFNSINWNTASLCPGKYLSELQDAVDNIAYITKSDIPMYIVINNKTKNDIKSFKPEL